MNHLGKMLKEYYDQNLQYNPIRYILQPDGNYKADMMSAKERVSEFNSERFVKDIVDIIWKTGQAS